MSAEASHRAGARGEIRRIGLVTGGGDSPGLNAAIRGATLTAIRRYGVEVVGLIDGFNGFFEPEGGYVDLGVDDVQGIGHLGGTILGTASRGDPFRKVLRDAAGRPELDAQGAYQWVDRSAEAAERARELGLDGLVLLGGDGTLTLGQHFYEQHGFPCTAVPKTIDFDLSGTEATFGFKTAVQVASDALDRLRTTAESHDRVLVLEVMGRYAGWIALHAGLAGGAHSVVVPEIPYDPRAIWARVTERFRRHRTFSLVVVAEGARPVGGAYAVLEDPDEPGAKPRLGGSGERLREELEELNRQEADRIRAGGGEPPEAPDTRVVVLGHIQRGGTPLADDRIMATACGSSAVDLLMAGYRHHMAAWRHASGPEPVPLSEAIQPHLIDPNREPLVEVAREVGIVFGDPDGGRRGGAR